MTAQIPDVMLLQDKKFSIAGVNGDELFNPAQFGLRPFPGITSCWRGDICTYQILYNKLLLGKLEISLHQQGPEIYGVRPFFSAGTFDNTYVHVNLQMDFTGEILVADKFIRGMYVHMGFHPAWKYETVYELSVSQGYVLNIKNVSEQMAQLREQMIRQPLDPPNT